MWRWERRWDYSTDFCQSACKIALAMLKGYRRKRKEGEPEAGKLFTQLYLTLWNPTLE